MMTVAAILKGKTIAPNVSLVISPGSRLVLRMLAANGGLANILGAGGRVLESTCGPCVGIGQAPPSHGTSLRTFNRNFEGRSGTKDAQVYLVSPEVAAASALQGVLTDPRKMGQVPRVTLPKIYPVDDNMIIPPLPADQAAKVEVVMGANIKPLPLKDPLPAKLSGRVLIKLGDHITTDHIIPGGTHVMSLRSNIPAISEHLFERVDTSFVKRAKEAGGGFVVAGVNYGQGSSREHAALSPMFMGIKAMIAKSFARIYLANLINFGIVPLTFKEEGDYQKLSQGDEIEIDVSNLSTTVALNNKTTGEKIGLTPAVNEREKEMLKAGGALPLAKKRRAN
jgi:aconitate hydratase